MSEVLNQGKALAIRPIGSSGLPQLLELYRDLAEAASHGTHLPGSLDHLKSLLLERESVDLDHSFFAWPAGDGSGDPKQPAAFGLLGVRRAEGVVRCSVRALAIVRGADDASGGAGGSPGSQPNQQPGQQSDARPALLEALLKAARSLGAASVTAEGAIDAQDHLAQPPVTLLEAAGFRQVDTLLGLRATREEILAEPVYLQIGLHEVDPEEFQDWLGTLNPATLPWPLHADAIRGLRFPEAVYMLIASGFAAGFMAVTDPQLHDVGVLNLWVLPDLRRQQVAKGALQEVLSSHGRMTDLHIPPVIRESHTEMLSFLQAVGFRPSGPRRLLMEASPM